LTTHSKAKTGHGCAFALFFFFLFVSAASASSVDSLITSYERGLNTDRWLWGFHFQKAFASLYEVQVTEQVLSSRLVVVGDEDKWKDDHRFTLDIKRRLKPSLLVNLLGSSLFFSDKQTGYYVNDMQTHMLGLGLMYSDAKRTIPFHAGIKEDRRFGQIDRGLTYSLGIHAPYFELGDYTNKLYGRIDEDLYPKRKNTTLGLSYRVNRRFHENASDTLQMGLTRQRRDYYISVNGDIESRIENGQSVENRLFYRVSPDLSCRVYGAISARQLGIHLMTGEDQGIKRQRQDFQTRGELHLYWKKKELFGNLSFLYQSEDQQYHLTEQASLSPFSGGGFLTPDNQSVYTTLLLHSGWRFSGKDSLLIYSALQRYRYDTPDPENFDDRDELRFRIDIQERHTFSRTLSLQLSLSLNFIHYVYIFGEKSADNNWTRIIRFSPSVKWQPSSKFRLAQSVEILANYVDYDYETLLPGIRSFLYRKLRLEDSSWVAITPRTRVHVHYRLELDENGKFIWNQWLEQKLIDRQSETISLFLDHQLWMHWHIGPGYYYYRRRGYRYMSEADGTTGKEISIDFHNHGPMIRVTYKSKRLHFSLKGSTFATRTHLGSKQLLTRVDVNMSCLF